MCPNDAQHYLVYRNAYCDATHASPVSMKLTSELLDAEWTAQTGEVVEMIEYTAPAAASTAKRVQFNRSAEEVLDEVDALLRHPGEGKDFAKKLVTACLKTHPDTVGGQHESSPQVLAGESKSAIVMNNSAAPENTSPPATTEVTASTDPSNVAKPDSSVANNNDDEWTPTEITAATDPSNDVKQSPTIGAENQNTKRTGGLHAGGGLHALKRKGGPLHCGSLHKVGRSLHKPKGSALHASSCAPEQ